MAPSDNDLVQVLLVGDVHRSWSRADGSYVERGGHARCIFVGDLGDEDVRIVREVAAIRAQVSVLLGNHDAWQSFSRKRVTERLHEILDVLGDRHLGYNRSELPEAGITIIGARPFSWGGPSLRSVEVYRELYGIETFEDSARLIADLASEAEHDSILLIAHNGPRGLSDAPHHIWGKDFADAKGDWGDEDLRLAIEEIRSRGQRIVCVAAGHMHDKVRGDATRRRQRFVRVEDTVYVNPAVVPRRRRRQDHGEVGHFVRLSFASGELVHIEEVWVDQDGREIDLRVPHAVVPGESDEPGRD